MLGFRNMQEKLEKIFLSLNERDDIRIVLFKKSADCRRIIRIIFEEFRSGIQVDAYMTFYLELCFLRRCLKHQFRCLYEQGLFAELPIEFVDSLFQ